MAEDDTSLYLLIIVAIVAVLGLGLAVTSFAWNESMGSMMGGGGGMMGSPGPATTTGPGLAEWTILLVSAAFFVLAVALLIRGRAARAHPMSPSSPVSTSPYVPTPEPAHEPAPAAPQGTSTPATSGTSVAEPTLVKLLDPDERQMYLELRDHGGEMFQRDLVALGTFSKAKVTRVLDKLEAKGLVVREAHGMTNRVRLLTPPAR